MSKMKKLIAGVSALVIGAACATVASADWQVKGYDTSALLRESFNNYRVGVVYELYDANGLSTGVVVSGAEAELYGLEPTAVVSFSAPGFERDYPNREFVAVYADGVDTGKILYNGVSKNLEYRDAKFMWELAAPHRIYKRTQAKIYGAWYTNETYPVSYAGDVATVKSEYKNYYGFGDWMVVDTDNNGVAEAMAYWTPAGNPAIVSYMNTDDNIYFETVNGAKMVAPNALDAGAVTNLTGAKNIEIKKAFSLVVSGPKFNFDGTVANGNEFAMIYDAATIKDATTLKNFAVNELVKNVYDHSGACALAEVKWVDAGFEAAAPYKYFQVLSVDGILLDGSYVNEVKLPYVYRYIIDTNGNYATANVTSTWTSELSGYKWNETVGKYEFLVDVTETVSVPGGPVIAKYVTKDVPSNVFGQLNYTENWKNNTKVVTAVLEGRALNGEVYRVAFEGATMDTINWGAPIFNYVDAKVDVKVDSIDNIIVLA